MNDDVSFGRWLKQRRKALDLTQEALAESVGCAVSTVRKIESGVLRPSRQMAELLAERLELPPDERTAFIKAARIVLSADRSAPPAPSADIAPAAQAHNDQGAAPTPAM